MRTDMVTVNEKVQELERIITSCGLISFDGGGQIQRMFLVATGIRELREAITDPMMQDIMLLQNQRLGFLTDKPGGYPIAVVKDCVIEALLRGLRIAGNEFNIIANNLYITKEGMARKVREFPELRGLKLTLGVPEMKAGGAIVDASAEWQIDGVRQTLTRQIPVRVNKGMGCDAILGKATRKLLASVFGQLTGSEYAVPDGEVDEQPLLAEPDRRQSKADLLAAELRSRDAEKGATTDDLTGSGLQTQPADEQDVEAAISQRQEEYTTLIDEMRTEEKRRELTTALDNEDVLTAQQVAGFRRKLAANAKQLGIGQDSQEN